MPDQSLLPFYTVICCMNDKILGPCCRLYIPIAVVVGTAAATVKIDPGECSQGQGQGLYRAGSVSRSSRALVTGV